MRERGIPATIVPTIVDVDRFVPRGKRHEDVHQSDVVIGWIGTHSTYVYFRTLLPALQRLAATHRFKVRVVGAGVTDAPASGVNIELKPWRLDTELDDLQSFDLAVYPIVQEEWAEGKSGFKAVQYLACGIPFVASPVGIVSQIGIPGVTHLEARSEDEWVAALGRLVTDAALRATMSREGRAYAVREYSTRHVASVLANVFRAVVEARRRS
jgi:glycosyltransferase involved in cell wall biosynthesis